MRNEIVFIASWALFGSMALGQANQSATAQRLPKPGQLESPVVESDGRVTFRMPGSNVTTADVVADNPIAQGSDYTGFIKHVHMTKDDRGLWSVTVGPLKPDFYSYTFVIDGVRIPDPGNVHRNREGTQVSSWAIVPGPGSANYQVNDVPHGQVGEVWYPSPTLSMTRRMIVYTPPGYESRANRYPVLYLLHGDRGDEEVWKDMGRAPEIFDNLLAQGKIVPMIVVMMNCDPSETLSLNDAPARVSQSGTRVESIRASIIHDVIPFVDKTYRTKTGRDNRAIAGVSRGGAETLLTALNNLDDFAWAGVFSGEITLLPGVKTDIPIPADAATRRGPEVGHSIDPTKFEELFPTLGRSLNTRLRLFYLTIGDDDGLVESWIDARKILDEKGVKYVWVEQPGYGHEWRLWRLNLQDFSARLFKPAR
jgi:enterochelin esterase-like enzyme